MADQYYCFYPGDYQRDTGDLTLVEHGAYRVLLDYYYMRECLPVEKNRLYRICRAFTLDEQRAVDVVVDRYFRLIENHLVNSKADKEIAKRKEFIGKMTNRGKAGARARWGESNPKDDDQEIQQAMPGHSLRNSIPSPSPSPSPSQKEKRGDKPLAPQAFQIPSLQEVELYCRERKNNVNPQTFIAFYESNGWKVGRNRMKCWRSAVRTWETRDNGNGSGKVIPGITQQKNPYVNCERCGAEVLEGEFMLSGGVKYCFKCPESKAQAAAEYAKVQGMISNIGRGIN